MSAEKRLAALEVADLIWSGAKDGAKWVGGVVAGEFNTKQSTGQIVTDAVISMFPIAGEITAARDAVAIGLRLADSPEDADDLIDWIALVLCLLAVVPVLGGVLKGVGKLVIRAASKSEDLVKLGKEILAFLRKMGYGDPAKWLRKLNFAKYQGEVMKAFDTLLTHLVDVSLFIPKRLGSVLPTSVLQYFKALPDKLERLRTRGARKIPKAIRELNRCLERLRTKLVDGSFADVTIATSGTSKVMVNEGRIGSKAVSELIPSRGHLPAPKGHYAHVDGWPDLRNFKKFGDQIATFSVKTPIEAVTLMPGSNPGLVRVIDMESLKQGKRFVKDGRFWAEKLPENGKAWRLDCAVKQKWSENGGYVELTRIPTVAELKKLGIAVPEGWTGMRTWRGKIAEQVDNEGSKATNLLLPGGETQHFIDFTDPYNKPVGDYTNKIKEKLTGWKDVNLPDNIEATVDYLPQRERSAKIRQEGYLRRGAATASKQTNNQESP